MQTLTPKQREIADREARILEIARPMVVHNGYHGLNMDRIAEAVNSSKGTIYNHFACKEEIIIALAIENVAKRSELFQKAAQFKGSSRERIHAIAAAAEKYVRDFPDFFLFEEIIQLPSVREKTSEKRQAVIQGCEMQCMSIVAGIVRDAVAREELNLPKDVTPEHIVFGLWSLTSGAYSIILKSQSLTQLGLSAPYSLVRRHTATFLDGMNWQPLSGEFDMEKLLKKIQRQVFAK